MSKDKIVWSLKPFKEVVVEDKPPLNALLYLCKVLITWYFMHNRSDTEPSALP